VTGPKDDYQFVIVRALNGAAAPAFSLQSSNYPDKYVSPTGAALAVGINALGGTTDADDASWTLVPGLSNASLSSVQSLSKDPSFAGLYLTLSQQNTAPCNYQTPDGDAVLSSGVADAAASTVTLYTPPPPPPALINITASQVTHRISFLRGCHIVRLDAGTELVVHRPYSSPRRTHPLLRTPATPSSPAAGTRN
jgi:hypothetical protein